MRISLKLQIFIPEYMGWLSVFFFKRTLQEDKKNYEQNECNLFFCGGTCLL